jgi:hypothetical protein
MADHIPPIILFVFNRPDKVERLLNALQLQTVRPQRLIIFIDAPRHESDKAAVQEVRNLVRSIKWTATEIIERPSNLRCARNISLGLSEVFKTYQSAIILEDDIVPATHFYEAMCLLLNEYAGQKKVFSVGGFSGIKKGEFSRYPYDVIFSPRFDCWGWGTWADRWQDIAGKAFPFINPYSSWKNVPLDVGRDLRDGARNLEQNSHFSWACPVAILCLHRGLVHAHTRYYLVRNSGCDGSGQNSFGSAYSRYIVKHAIIQDRVPKLLPAYENTDPRVTRAVRRFMEGSFSTEGARWKGAIVRLLKKMKLRK